VVNENVKQTSYPAKSAYFDYLAYGLKIKSTLPLPELKSASKGNEQILIKESHFKLPKMSSTSIYRQGIEALFGANENGVFLHWEGVASFCSQNGKELLVMKAKDNLDHELLNLYILSEALGMTLYQRGYFLLHGSAVIINEGVIVFLGIPGAGKSTMAGAFVQGGFTLIADDMVALKVNDEISAIPAFPQLKLWPSAVEGLNYSESSTQPLFYGSRKKIIRINDNFPYHKELPLLRIYFLETGNDFHLEKVTEQEALINLTRFFSCPHQLLKGENLARHFHQSRVIVNKVPVYKLCFPKNFTILKTIVEKLTNSL
jgi:hypothetical protein